MSKKLYGLLNNRMEEGHNFTGRELRAGDDITMYLWSDRACYYITDVIDQKRIKVKRYNVCADHSKPGGMGHQDWMYFKTWDDWNAYLAKYFPDHHSTSAHMDEPEAETWVFRYGKWARETKCENRDWCDTDRERKQFDKNGFFLHYAPLSGRVSFGVRDYHYDWEF